MTLIQNNKIENFPVILMGTAYWQPLIDQLRHMVAQQTIDERDLQLFLATDDVDEAMAHLLANTIEPFGLRRRPAPHPSRILGELRPRLRHWHAL